MFLLRISPLLLPAEDGGEAEVADLDVVVGVDEDVDGLEVAVDHALGVDVHEAFQDLPEHPPDPLPVLVEAALVDGVAQRLLVAVLHLDVHAADLHLWQRPLK